METTPESIQPADHQDRPTTRPLAEAVTPQSPRQPCTQVEQMRELRLNAAVDLLLAYLLDDSQAVAATSAKEKNATPPKAGQQSLAPCQSRKFRTNLIPMASPSIKSQFLLDPHIVFLNHGSFGACPRPVFENYQGWQRKLEHQPVEFLGRHYTVHLAEARAKLAAYLGTEADNLVYFTNPTTALNMVARSLKLNRGDEILTTDHEYGALDRTWRFVCEKSGATYVRHPIPLPVTSPEAFVEHFWKGVTDRTRVIFLSHITSPTALIFPIQELCRRARQSGILTVIDGAHAPGQIPLNLSELGADLYAGTCHKWINSPKGSAFLYARPEVQLQLEPLVVSWGWEDETFVPDPAMGDTQFIRYHQWQGTRDVAAFLATPAAIQFQADNNWETVRAACHAFALETRQRVNALTGLPAICPDSPDWIGQMVSVRLPPVNVTLLKTQLYDQYRIEVPVLEWQGQPFLRVSFQAYNSQEDADALVEALSALLKR